MTPLPPPLYEEPARKHIRKGRVGSWLWYDDARSYVRTVDLVPEGAEVFLLVQLHSEAWATVRVSMSEAVVREFFQANYTPEELAFRVTRIANNVLIQHITGTRGSRKFPSVYDKVDLVQHAFFDREGVDYFIEVWGR
jgi:hypothetical protein